SKDITGSEGLELDGRRIVLCVTGSVAAYRAVDMARLLMRHGGDVYAVMTESSSSLLLSPEMMKWATGNEVVTRLTGNLEHIMLADYGMSDLILVYPCTANTIGKMASGIDDTTVTSVLSVALGSKIPILIAPAMHEAMYENKFIQQNVRMLRENGVYFVDPRFAEGKAKVAEPDQVLGAAVKILSKGPLSGKRILVTAGSTVEHIDPIRVITNMSSGRMGAAIAREAIKMGACVTVIYGHGSTQSGEFGGCRVISAISGKEMHNAVISELSARKYDIAIMAAAVSDFAPLKGSEKKIDTRAGRLELSLKPTKKIIDDIKKISKRTFLVAFKAEYDVKVPALVDKAFKKLQESHADLVVANDLGRTGSLAGSDKSEVFIVNKEKKVVHLPLQDKQSVARKLLQIIARPSSP
ncbi:MAG: bifunctional phosphopantothenoylcysteine decarboxylase/phosphopantothenate--cysteine ligase CoaBC, partial [Nitrososphaera sp.]|nr:bifunctional phosphopantothenoylcysteine decarboxylase/phosphopantothenate--cysteine ligase CoaBC [Nitrososphaera sp.]